MNRFHLFRKKPNTRHAPVAPHGGADHHHRWQRETANNIRGELWRLIESCRVFEKTSAIPHDYLSLLRVLVDHYHRGTPAMKGMDGSAPYGVIPPHRVAHLHRWVREWPLYALVLVTCMACGLSEDEAWSVAEGI